MVSDEEYFLKEEQKIYKLLDDKYSRNGVYAFVMTEVSYHKCSDCRPRIISHCLGYKKEEIPNLVRSGWILNGDQSGKYIRLLHTGEVS